MTKFKLGLLIAAGVFVVLVGTAGMVFYFRVYKPIGSPLMAIAATQVFDRQLQNQQPFEPQAGVPSEDQIARFAAVEEAVAARVGAGADKLASVRSDLERANDTGQLSTRTVLAAFGDIKPILLDAKAAQIEAMNRAKFSRAEFEWVRRRIYDAGGKEFGQLDVSELLEGVPTPTLTVLRFTPDDSRRRDAARLGASVTGKLDSWRTLAFFGL